MAERKAVVLDQLQEMTGSDLVLQAAPTGEGELAVGEVVFASGTTVRLTPCSRRVMRQLASLAANQVAVLDRAADHGRFWGLYFMVAGQRVGVLAREISLIRPSGGRRLPSLPELLPA